jgi:hypothetical protein
MRLITQATSSDTSSMLLKRFPQTSVLTQQFLAKKKIVVIPHPLYSPDLAPCDFFLFLSRIHRENHHRSRTRLQINACKNCALPPSYVQLGTLTHYAWESYHLPAISATTNAVEVAAPVSKILDPPLYIGTGLAQKKMEESVLKRQHKFQTPGNHPKEKIQLCRMSAEGDS